ncbi:MAG: SMP-30/gluconolactonase/LRE family protein [Saprospiraceae bacterium]|nr:SMP-30/gluconolactonase/LRE family protein [Saprospiraceae bacterium]
MRSFDILQPSLPDHIILICLLVIGFSSICMGQTRSKIIANNATLQQVISTCKFTEGPAVDRYGNVYFTDQPNDRIMRWSNDGSVSVYMENTGRSNGLYFDHDGFLIACADENNELWKIDEKKKVTVLLDKMEGKRFNGPNDLWIDNDGGIYFTDPFYKREYWSHTEPELDHRDVYYLSPDHSQVRMVASDFVQPNGIVGTPDGKKLYVADIGDKKTYGFQIDEDGGLSDRTLFVEMGSDGMTLDNKGNLYITGDGVTVFNNGGEQIEHIKIDERWTANVCFGGKKQKTLFVTAMGSLYTLDMKVKGVR